VDFKDVPTVFYIFLFTVTGTKQHYLRSGQPWNGFRISRWWCYWWGDW